MDERRQIEQAIAVLDSRRSHIGSSVAETTIAALQERAAALNADSITPGDERTPKRKQVTTLFANVTGFPAMAESNGDSSLLDVFKVLWRRLDAAIAEQGGVIDKHIGDGVMGLFGVPIAGEDDPARAVRAALAMRTALRDFVSEMSLVESASLDAWRRQIGIRDTRPFRNLQLRVGINTGPVLLGEVGSSDEYTVIGAAVNVASRLEQAADADSILISHETYLLVRGVFDVEPVGPIGIRGKQDPVQVYRVLSANPRSFLTAGRGVEGIKAQMVGRSREMLQLQRALRDAFTTDVGQAITIVGEAGVGKSRLVLEFLDWVSELPDEFIVFNGRGNQRAAHMPFALLRDLLAEHFGIQATDPATLVEDKLARGMVEYLGQDSIEVRRRTHGTGQLIGLSVSSRTIPQATATEIPQVRERILNYVTEFFEAVARKHPAMLMILEDMQWADDRSLEFLSRLSLICTRVPLVMIYLTRSQSPTLSFQDGKEGSANEESVAHPEHKIIDLAPLSSPTCHQLVKDILRHVPQIPSDLIDMVVTRAEGNPFYIEELIKVLIEDGVIIANSKRWSIQRSEIAELRMPPTLTGILQARLDRLSTAERATLERAAVVGRIFWDHAVIKIGEMADRPMRAPETLTAVQSLEKKELIFRRQTSAIGGSQAYMFKNAVLRDVAYETVLLRKRPLYHKLVADWMAQQSGDRLAEYSGLIAEHYEQAGEKVLAAELFEEAATRAREMYNPDVAIERYRRALSLLSVDQHHTEWQLRLQAELGSLLRLQSRMVEAIQTYMTMQYIAKLDGDLGAEARALNGMAELWGVQADYEKMLESASRAEHVAWLIGADRELVGALLLQSEASYRTGDIEYAVTTAREALGQSHNLDAAREYTISLRLLCSILVGSGRHSEAIQCLDMLEKESATLETDLESRGLLAFQKASLGVLYDRLGWVDRATFCLLGALDMYRELDDQSAIARTLNVLGETARLRGDPGAAIPLYREALSIADAIGDRYSALIYRSNLGGALVSLAEYEEGARELDHVHQFVRDVELMSNWAGLPKACCFLAEAYLGQRKIPEALTMALQAHSFALQMTELLMLGAAWRVLGMVASQLPEQELPIIVEGVSYRASDCFAESTRILNQLNGDETAAYREQVQTLWAWSAHEMSNGNRRFGIKMRGEAELLEERLKLGRSELEHHPVSAEGSPDNRPIQLSQDPT